MARVRKTCSCYLFPVILGGMCVCFLLSGNDAKSAKPPAKGNSADAVLKDSEIEWQGSLMYTAEEMNRIKLAVQSFDTKTPMEILLPDLFPPQRKQIIQLPEAGVQTDTEGEKTEDQVVHIPSVYLSSILYLGESNWVLWVNGQKISRDELAVPGVRILRVEPKRAYFIWPRAALEVVVPSWRLDFKPLGDTEYLSNKNSIVINSDTQDVSFVLEPNQTFSGKDMEIYEGKLSVGVNNENKEAPDGSVGQEGDATATADEAVKEGEIIAKTLAKPLPQLEAIMQYKKQMDMLKEFMINP